MKNLFCLFLNLFIGVSVFAQSAHFKGIILEKINNEPIPFATISVDGKAFGTTSDIDGMFRLEGEQATISVTISHLSYKSLQRELVAGKEIDTIFLEPKSFELKVVSIRPEENPAHRIIDSVRANAKFNNPNKIARYTCTIYEKFIVSVDSAFFAEPKIAEKASDIEDMQDFFLDKDLLLVENVVEKTFIAPDRSYNKVTATKLSGANNPAFVMLLSQLQETTLYDPMVDIGGIKYLGPLSRESQKRYFFLLEDTTFSEKGDTIFHLSFRPRTGSSFDGVKGFMAINSSGWAIQNSVAASASQEVLNQKTEINIRQIFRQDDDGHWFFHQTHTDLKISILDEMSIIGVGRSYFENVRINPPEKPKNLWETGITLDDDAFARDDRFWEQHRAIPLSERNQNTYQFLDSLNTEYNLDSKIRILEELLNLKVKVWKFNLDLDKIINYQEYQGFYLGLGVSTNRDFSKTFQLGGFWGYGSKDKKAKYGGYANAMLYRPLNLKLQVEYSYDGVGVGSCRYYYEPKSLLSEDFYAQYYVRKVDYRDYFAVSAFVNPLPYLQTQIVFAHDRRNPGYDYLFAPTQQTDFKTTTLELRARYAFREPRMKSALSNHPILLGNQNKYPVLSATLTKGFKNLLDGDFDYWRVDAKLNYKIQWQRLGRTKLMLQGGAIFGEVPYSLLSSPTGTHIPDFSLYIPHTFNLIRRNEFTNDRYFSFFFSHDFKEFYKSHNKLFAIRPGIVTNIGWGTLKNPENHEGVTLKDMRHGYFESGIVMRKLLVGLDFGVVYRYGAYTLDKTMDNFSFIMSASF